MTAQVLVPYIRGMLSLMVTISFLSIVLQSCLCAFNGMASIREARVRRVKIHSCAFEKVVDKYIM